MSLNESISEPVTGVSTVSTVFEIVSEKEILPAFTYCKKVKLNIDSLDAFNVSSGKNKNDEKNKTRENIIGAIINNKVPIEYFNIKKWSDMKTAIFNYIGKIRIKPYVKVECVHRGGRKYNYDFTFIFYDEDGTQETFDIELKFNASGLDNAPQFVSPMNPSQYLNSTCSYEEFHYDNYMERLSVEAGLPIPPKEEYLKQISSPEPKCMKEYQMKYYQGCSGSSKFTNNEDDIKFYNVSKNISNDSITTFINKTDLNIELLSAYLYNTQKNKTYMLYFNGEFILQNVDMIDYNIKSVTKNEGKFRYECITESGKTLNVLLRWKNGNGIAFPAFQIS
jgi:hypothetical protein